MTEDEKRAVMREMGRKGGLKSAQRLTKEQRRVGGNVTKARYGVEYYQRIGAKGGKARSRNDAEAASRHGKLGGAITLAKYGPEHYQMLAQKAAEARRRKKEAQRNGEQ